MRICAQNKVNVAYSQYSFSYFCGTVVGADEIQGDFSISVSVLSVAVATYLYQPPWTTELLIYKVALLVRIRDHIRLWKGTYEDWGIPKKWHLKKSTRKSWSSIAQRCLNKHVNLSSKVIQHGWKLLNWKLMDRNGTYVIILWKTTYKNNKGSASHC